MALFFNCSFFWRVYFKNKCDDHQIHKLMRSTVQLLQTVNIHQLISQKECAKNSKLTKTNKGYDAVYVCVCVCICVCVCVYVHACAQGKSGLVFQKNITVLL